MKLVLCCGWGSWKKGAEEVGFGAGPLGLPRDTRETLKGKAWFCTFVSRKGSRRLSHSKVCRMPCAGRSALALARLAAPKHRTREKVFCLLPLKDNGATVAGYTEYIEDKY